MLLALSMDEAIVMITPLALFVLGMLIYSIFVFKFYKFVSRKDIFAFNLHQYNRIHHEFFKRVFGVILFGTEYLILFPLLTMFWLAILAIMILFLTKEPIVTTILLSSAALVTAVRVTAYYNEELSAEIAKLLPLIFLGVFLIDINDISLQRSADALSELPKYLSTFIYYFGFSVILEFILRMLYSVWSKRVEAD